MNAPPTLALVWPVKARRLADGQWNLSEKFVVGVQEFCGMWPGKVEVYLPAADSMGNDLDYRIWHESELPCRFAFFDARTATRDVFKHSPHTTVLLLPHPDLLPMAKSCLAGGLPLILVTELSLRTQLQIASVATKSTGRWLRSVAWHFMEYLRWSRIAARSAGVQCNGTPTYRHFRRLNRNTLLYFDTRSTARDCTTAEHVERRLTAARVRGFPRLAFSGRLISMKGAEHLIRLATELKARGFRFELWIAGDGDRRDEMEAEVQRAGLATQVRFLGVLDFRTQLLPALQADMDMFVCPHLQGDPSCTYVETMSAGVPIVGYANESLRGLFESFGVGRTVPMHSVKELASAIIDAWETPGRLLPASLKALAFAKEHCFEAEFQRRTAHVLGASQPGLSKC